MNGDKINVTKIYDDYVVYDDEDGIPIFATSIGKSLLTYLSSFEKPIIVEFHCEIKTK